MSRTCLFSESEPVDSVQIRHVLKALPNSVHYRGSHL